MIKMLLTVYAGFTHAFEADHLLAVSSIVSSRNRTLLAAKDGIYWGLGHTSSILIVGLLMIVLKMNIGTHTFEYFEAAVGLMLMVLAVSRLWQLSRGRRHTHVHASVKKAVGRGHAFAYSVGMVHGLAGSGALVVLVLAQMQSPANGIMYLLIFGLGSVIGMVLAAGLFSVPFSRSLMKSAWLQTLLTLLSCVLCLVYGGKIIYENLLV